MTHILNLDGCAPVPLAHYLKALGILRLVAEQVDSQARGWWEGERFRLATLLDRDELEGFFLSGYVPTPMFNPWGARSGFYDGSSESSARALLVQIEKAEHPRFAGFRAASAAVREVIAAVSSDQKPKDGVARDRVIRALRNSLRGTSTLWLDTVVAVIGADEIAQPALFGTGGSEGSGGYPSAYMAAIHECLLERRWDHALSAVLFGENRVPRRNWDQTLGQFLPGASAAPWDLLLAFEGACVVRSAITSRVTSANNRWMSSPFFAAPTSYGYVSAARLDEFAVNKGKELPGRGEQWFPLWAAPTLYAEVTQVFTEGRAMTKRGRAVDGWSMARAVTSLGVRRGVREFVRYGYQQRNNLATHFAVPLGRFRIPDHSPPALACLDDLDAWLPGLHRQARAKEAPARLAQAERRLADALFTVVQHSDEAARWQAVLLALAAVEGVQAHGSGFAAGPVPKLEPRWVEAADDGGPELRLALSLALQQGGFAGEHRDWWNTTRRHWLPLDKKDPRRFARSGSDRQARLQIGPEVVMKGRSGIDDAIALVDRRLIEASQHGERRVPLLAARGAAAPPSAVVAFLAGEVDFDRTFALARALMALNSRAWFNEPVPLPLIHDDRQPDDAWLVLRLALLPWPLKDRLGGEIRIGADPAIFRRLAGGDAATAVKLALRRLAAAGVRTAVRTATVPLETARLWAAALAFPITKSTARAFLRRLDPTAIQKETTA
jgi:CRISPR-associated protein Csx17